MADGTESRQNPMRQFRTSTASAATTMVRDPANAQWLLIGDSVAMSWIPAMSSAGAARSQQVASMGYGGCQLVDGLPYTHPLFGDRFPANCLAAQALMLEELLRASPQLLVLTGHPAVLERLSLPLPEAERVWKEHFANLLQQLKHIPFVLILESSPWGRDSGECINRISGPRTCITELDEWHLAKARAEQAATEKFQNTVFIPTRDWFCQDGRCPSTIGNLLVSVDGLHMTYPASLALSKVLGQRIDEAIKRISEKKLRQTIEMNE